MKVELIKADIEKLINKKGYHLYDLKFSKKENSLQVIIDESLDMKKLEKLSEELSKLLDKLDTGDDSYILDVSSVGLEREIRNEEEIKKALGSQVFCKTKEFKVEGKLREFKDGVVYILYMDKNIKKQKCIELKDIKLLRYAVDFKGEK